MNFLADKLITSNYALNYMTRDPREDVLCIQLRCQSRFSAQTGRLIHLKCEMMLIDINLSQHESHLQAGSHLLPHTLNLQIFGILA